jgi:class 3 adenylate cyclase
MADAFDYRWEWDLESSPEALWPLVSDTNRTNAEAGLPLVERIGGDGALQRVKLTYLGIPVEWDEYPYEWVKPKYFSVLRKYHSGPVAEMLVNAELEPNARGTRLTYSIRAIPRGFLGRLLIPIKIGVQTRKSFEAVFRRFDQLAGARRAPWEDREPEALPPGGRERLDAAAPELGSHAPKLASLLERGDAMSLARLRPYALADLWGIPRREALELCLRAVRSGVLDSRWDVLCPLCRGAKQTGRSLAEIKSAVHCDACNIDFTANFDRSVELSFRPNAAIRPLDLEEYCVGSPQRTPHIVAQQRVPANESRTIAMPVEPGRYRLRARGLAGFRHLRVEDGGAAELEIDLGPWPEDEPPVAPFAKLRLRNRGPERVVVLERTSWNDDAATAADVTTIQVFRDLFANEALRPGEQLGVESLTVIFTDLRNSTQLYRRIGDAPAFGKVMSHFDVLRAAIAAEEGALVKTMGDAVMAVFRRPVSAVSAMMRALDGLAASDLRLKVGIHRGPCIAVTLNDRLDYFGSTINIAARLEGLSEGGDIVISDAIHADPEVGRFLAGREVEALETTLKGFDQERFRLWRVRR